MILSQKQNTNLILFTLGIGALVGCLNMMIFNVALPTMATVFDAPLSKVQWLTSGYMLAAGMMIPAVGYLGDRFGYKRLYSFILIVVLFCSFIGIFAWCIEFLIVIRFITGLTCGMLASLSLAMMYRYLPVSQHTNAATVWGMANMLGAIFPTVLTGLILSVADWRFLLLFTVPFLIIDLIICMYVLPKDTAFKSGKLDFTGLFLLGFGSFALLFAFSNLSKWGFSAQFFVVLAVGTVAIGTYCFQNKNNNDAVLNLGVFKHKRYVAAFLAFGFNTMATCIVAFLMPLFLQNGLGVTPLMTGMIMLPASIISTLTMPIASKFYDTIGENRLGAFGVSIVIIGSLPFLVATPETAIALVIVIQMLRNCGMSIFNLVSTNAQMSAIPVELSGHASAMTSWFGQMVNALMVGIASNVIDIRIHAVNATTTEEIAWAYTSSTNMIVAVSCVVLLCVIPLSLKYFRKKATSKM